MASAAYRLSSRVTYRISISGNVINSAISVAAAIIAHRESEKRGGIESAWHGVMKSEKRKRRKPKWRKWRRP